MPIKREQAKLKQSSTEDDVQMEFILTTIAILASGVVLGLSIDVYRCRRSRNDTASMTSQSHSINRTSTNHLASHDKKGESVEGDHPLERLRGSVKKFDRPTDPVWPSDDDSQSS